MLAMMMMVISLAKCSQLPPPNTHALLEKESFFGSPSIFTSISILTEMIF